MMREEMSIILQVNDRDKEKAMNPDVASLALTLLSAHFTDYTVS